MAAGDAVYGRIVPNFVIGRGTIGATEEDERPLDFRTQGSWRIVALGEGPQAGFAPLLVEVADVLVADI